MDSFSRIAARQRLRLAVTSIRFIVRMILMAVERKGGGTDMLARFGPPPSHYRIPLTPSSQRVGGAEASGAEATSVVAGAALSSPLKRKIFISPKKMSLLRAIIKSDSASDLATPAAGEGTPLGVDADAAVAVADANADADADADAAVEADAVVADAAMVTRIPGPRVAALLSSPRPVHFEASGSLRPASKGDSLPSRPASKGDSLSGGSLRDVLEVPPVGGYASALSPPLKRQIVISSDIASGTNTMPTAGEPPPGASNVRVDIARYATHAKGEAPPLDASNVRAEETPLGAMNVRVKTSQEMREAFG